MNDIVSSYTRAQAIQDGILIDVSTTAREAGFRWPMAITSAAWHASIAVNKSDIGQDEQGRLWDVLSVLRYQSRDAGYEPTVYFEVLIAKGGKRPEPIRLKAHCGAGDELEPVITIMLPEED